MCGIICCIGNNIIPVLLNGLKMIEYRGYDSAGIAVIEHANKNHQIKIIKQKGAINEFIKNLEIIKLKEEKHSIGIAHTRWATHGEPNDVNAHPHTDCKGKIAIVHNGIIENFSVLKKILKKEGHKFLSETDSEVLAHLIEKFYEGNLKYAVQESLKLIEGTFGIAVIHSDHNEIVLARRGSPLVIGIGKGCMYAASDATPLLLYTKKVIYLHDNELAIITPNKYHIQNIDGEKIDKKIEQIKWTVKQVEKKGYKHFMLKEIFEQAEAVSNTSRGRINNKKIKLSVDTKGTERIIIVACGTSWHSALIGKHLIEKIANIPTEIDYASEFRYRNPILKPHDLVVVISQSGETADTLAALREAKSKNIKTLGIVNVVGSTIAREVNSGIYLHAGPEIGVASTKAFTCQVTALALLALYLQQEKGLNPDKKLMGALMKLPKLIEQTLKNSEDIKKIAKHFINSKNFLFLGRGLNFPTAIEGALKLKEISYIHAEGYPAAEMKHGPIALIDENMPVLIIATKNNLSEKILSNIQEVKARKGKTIIVMNKDPKNKNELKKLTDYPIIVPEIIDELSPIINVISLQLLAYYIADYKKLDVDKPRNLAKSVTVE